MGVASSSNVDKTINDILQQNLETAAQGSMQGTNQSQIVKVNTDGGDIDISGNAFNQTVKADWQAAFDALQNSKIQADILNQATQKAEALVKGLNFGQISDAENFVEQYTKAAMKANQAMQQQCAQAASQAQTIDVSCGVNDGYVFDGKGFCHAVHIKSNTFSQGMDVLGACALRATQTATQSLKLQNIVDQTAVAKSVGLEFGWLALIAIVGIVCFTVFTVYTESVISSWVMYLLAGALLVTGLVFIILYYTQDASANAVVWPYTPPIDPNAQCINATCAPSADPRLVPYHPGPTERIACKEATYVTNDKVQTTQDAFEICQQAKDCTAMAWHVDAGCDADAIGTAVTYFDPQTDSLNRGNLKTHKCQAHFTYFKELPAGKACGIREDTTFKSADAQGKSPWLPWALFIHDGTPPDTTDPENKWIPLSTAIFDKTTGDLYYVQPSDSSPTSKHNLRVFQVPIDADKKYGDYTWTTGTLPPTPSAGTAGKDVYLQHDTIANTINVWYKVDPEAGTDVQQRDTTRKPTSWVNTYAVKKDDDKRSPVPAIPGPDGSRMLRTGLVHDAVVDKGKRQKTWQLYVGISFLIVGVVVLVVRLVASGRSGPKAAAAKPKAAAAKPASAKPKAAAAKPASAKAS